MIFGRPKQDGPPPADRPGVLARVLLVVDGSESAAGAAQLAVALASQLQSQLIAVYVVDTATMDYLMQLRILVQDERDEFEADLERTGQRSLESVAALARARGVEVDSVLRKGRLHSSILHEARRRRAELIILAGWSHSITRKDAASVERQLVLDQSECPVLVVKGDTGHRAGSS